MYVTGKMLVFGAMLGCLDPVLTVAAALAHGRPVFLSAPPDAQQDLERARSATLRPALDARSDHIALIAVFNGWAKARSKGESVFCLLTKCDAAAAGHRPRIHLPN